MSDTIASFMKSPAITVDPDSKMMDVIKIMRDRTIGSVLITQNDQLLGIFTDKDVIKSISQNHLENLIKPISHFMTPNPIRIQTNDTSTMAFEAMALYNIRHLPVFDAGSLVGVISLRDLVHELKKQKEPKAQTIRESETAPHTKVKELNGFQMRNISILAHLYTHDAVDDEIVEFLRESELEFFSMTEKCSYLEERVNIDEKTGLLKYKSDYLTAILKTASRVLSGFKEDYDISFVRFDIDDFSIFNNKYGHETGDRVLVQFAKFLKEHSRPTDYIIRFGGEEFDVILPKTNKEGLVCFLEKIYKAMDCLTVMIDAKPISITVSSGATTLNYKLNSNFINQGNTQSLFELIQNQADNALYDSKYSGKNRFSLYQSDKSEEYKTARSLYSASKKK
jgi:diguanylate cyclase (GGDEF)-like protein